MSKSGIALGLVAAAVIAGGVYYFVFYKKGPKLSASYSNGVVNYAYSGFEPDQTVTLTVVNTGGYILTTSGSDGSAKGNFGVTETSGMFTLQAVDEAGNIATTTYRIS